MKRQTIAKVLFALGSPLVLLALLCVAVPMIGTYNGLRYEGIDLSVWFFFYLLLALPAAILIGIGIWLRGWKEARFGKIALTVLFGVPAMIVAVAFVAIVMHSGSREKEPIQPPETTRGK